MSRFFSVLCVLAVLLSSCAGKESASTDSGCEAIEFKDLFIDDHWGGSEIVLFSVRLD